MIHCAKVTRCHPWRLHGFREFFNGHLSLCQDGLDCFWGQVSPMPGDYDVQVGLGLAPEIDVASGLIMNVEPGSQESL